MLTRESARTSETHVCTDAACGAWEFRTCTCGSGRSAQVAIVRNVGNVMTARSCCLELLLCRVVWKAAQASRVAVGGWFVSL